MRGDIFLNFNFISFVFSHGRSFGRNVFLDYFSTAVSPKQRVKYISRLRWLISPNSVSCPVFFYVACLVVVLCCLSRRLTSSGYNPSGRHLGTWQKGYFAGSRDEKSPFCLKGPSEVRMKLFLLLLCPYLDMRSSNCPSWASGKIRTFELTFILFILFTRQYHTFSSPRMDLAWNNPQTFLCH